MRSSVGFLAGLLAAVLQPVTASYGGNASSPYTTNTTTTSTSSSQNATTFANGTAPVSFAIAQDCQIAADSMPFANVNCYYKWDNTNSNNHLNYVVQISGTGQRQAGWCDGIAANIHGRCGLSGSEVPVKNCGTDNEHTKAYGYNYDTGKDTDMYGIDMNFWMMSWAAGEDNRACVAYAIRDATCSTVNLGDFACYNSEDDSDSNENYES